MVDFGRNVLGKGVVVCKDTPNFIGNRFFAVAASYGIEHALQQGYTVPRWTPSPGRRSAVPKPPPSA
jgi:3-hydroxyacyl-CoA dehydrogenase